MTQTETDTTLDTMSHWPPVIHIVRSKPPKKGDIALCGAKIMGIDFTGMAIENPCKKCEEIANRA